MEHRDRVRDRVFDDVSKAFMDTKTSGIHVWGTRIENLLSALSYESLHTWMPGNSRPALRLSQVVSADTFRYIS